MLFYASLTLLMVLLSAFFSGAEIAFFSANKLKIELKRSQGLTSGIILSRFVKNEALFITSILLGNNLALVLYGIFIAKLLEPAILSLGILSENNVFGMLSIQTGVSTIVILIFGEYLPKAVFRLNPDRIITSLPVAVSLRIIYGLFSPFVFFVNQIARFFITKIMRQNYEEQELEFSKRDLDVYLRESLGEGEGAPVHEIDTVMFTNAMNFNEIKARDSMVPRTEIVAISVNATIEELTEIFVKTEHSKVIVYGQNLDQIVGYVHSSSLFRKPRRIQQIVQPVLMIPEGMAANVLLSEFSKNRKSVAIVVDEFGGTEGLVTMEDLVEEVFGDIEDEHDEPAEDELLVKKLDENTWLFSARHEVDEINKEYEMSLPEGDYKTLAGMVMFFAESIPPENESIDIGRYRVTVNNASDNKINTLTIHCLENKKTM